jgi:hypothetical protein
MRSDFDVGVLLTPLVTAKEFACPVSCMITVSQRRTAAALQPAEHDVADLIVG